MSVTREQALCTLGEDLIKCFQKYLDTTKRDSTVLTKIFMHSIEKKDMKSPGDIAKEALREAVDDGLKIFEISRKLLRDKLTQAEKMRDGDTSWKYDSDKAEGA